jgi:hypothetical protein
MNARLQNTTMGIPMVGIVLKIRSSVKQPLGEVGKTAESH